MIHLMASRSRWPTQKLRQPHVLFSVSVLKSPLLLFFSSSSADNAVVSSSSSHLMFDYFVNSIGLSKKEASLASAKVSHLKSTKNPDLIINLFKHYGGLNKTHIKNLVSTVPQVLLHRFDQTLELKFKTFKDLGLSGPNLVNLVKREPNLFVRGLDSRIIPTLNYLRDLLGSDENVVKVINKCSKLLRFKLSHNLQPNVLLLESYGVPKDRIAQMIIRNPKTLVQKPEWLKNLVLKAERELGIASNFRMFCVGILALSRASDLTIEKKRDVFKSFGWSDSDISTLFKTFPTCINISEAKIYNALDFAMKELGYTPAYMASRPLIFSYNLETRVKPRYQVVKVLKDKGVKVSASLYTLFNYSEPQFVNFLLRYKNEAPNLLEIYQSSMKNKSRRTSNKTLAEKP